MQCIRAAFANISAHPVWQRFAKFFGCENFATYGIGEQVCFCGNTTMQKQWVEHTIAEVVTWHHMCVPNITFRRQSGNITMFTRDTADVGGSLKEISLR